MTTLPVYSATKIQDAIVGASNTTGVAQIPAGIYVATEPVRLMSNVKLIFDPAAILRRKFDQ
jgi:polygalacturonase